MPKVSVIIPTRNRLELLIKAVKSVRAQTYEDWELIVVDDASDEAACPIVSSFSDSRMRCTRHDHSKGGSAARNTGIRESNGEYIAFLDDDDVWIPEKLAIQMDQFSKTGKEVGFCFSAVRNLYSNREEVSHVLDGIQDHHARALGNPKGYLTTTLIVKRFVFDEVGLFDETLPSHQESDLVIRMAKQFKGLGIDQPLVHMYMHSSHIHIGGNTQNRIKGREMLINKHLSDLKKHPEDLAFHYFQLGLWYRKVGDFPTAEKMFWRSFITKLALRPALHMLAMFGGGIMYRLLRTVRTKMAKLKNHVLSHEPFKAEHVGYLIRFKYFRRYFLSYLKEKNSGNVLDAGCGPGEYANFIASSLPALSVFGYDIVDQQSWRDNELPNLTFVRKDLRLLNENAKYDFVLSIDSLEHIPDNVSVVSSFCKALKTNGMLYIHVPSEKEEIHIFPRKWFHEFHKWEEEEHIGTQHTLEELRKIVENFGMKIVLSRHTFTLFGIFAWEVECLLRSSKNGRRLNLVLMPLYKLLGLLDVYFPIGLGDNLIIARKAV